jgi:hypothetical protein
MSGNGKRRNGRPPRTGPIGHDGRNAVPMPADVHTAEEWETYFDGVSQGIGPDLAARAIGSTGSRIRTLIRRDPEFQAKLAQAAEDAAEHYRDRLRATARLEALGAEGRPPNPRILEVELATHGGADYSHLRRDRVKHEGRIEHALVLDASRLDELPVEELEEVRAALSKLAAHEIIDQPRRELTA